MWPGGDAIHRHIIHNPPPPGPIHHVTHRTDIDWYQIIYQNKIIYIYIYKTLYYLWWTNYVMAANKKNLIFCTAISCYLLVDVQYIWEPQIGHLWCWCIGGVLVNIKATSHLSWERLGFQIYVSVTLSSSHLHPSPHHQCSTEQLRRLFTPNLC